MTSGLINQILGYNCPGLLQLSPALVAPVGVITVPQAFRVWRLLSESGDGYFSQTEHEGLRMGGMVAKGNMGGLSERNLERSNFVFKPI